jgi:hypothetical protein
MTTVHSTKVFAGAGFQLMKRAGGHRIYRPVSGVLTSGTTPSRFSDHRDHESYGAISVRALRPPKPLGFAPGAIIQGLIRSLESDFYQNLLEDLDGYIQHTDSARLAIHRAISAHHMAD